MGRECAQHLDDHVTPCFKALGECSLPVCPVLELLISKGYDPHHLTQAGKLHLRHELHWTCPRSIHNSNNLTTVEQEKLRLGLIASCNKYYL